MSDPKIVKNNMDGTKRSGLLEQGCRSTAVHAGLTDYATVHFFGFLKRTYIIDKETETKRCASYTGYQ